MTKPNQPTGRDAAIAAGLAAGCAVVMGISLASFAAPRDFNARLAVVGQQLDQVRGLMRKAQGPEDIEAKAICVGDPGREAQRLRDVLGSYAGQQSLSLSGLDLTPEGQLASGATLTPIRMTFRASGSYEGALTLLDMLSKLQPEVFAETVDLTSRTSSVTLAFSGRVYCSA